MSDYDRKTHLQQVHEQRRKKTNERVDKAIKRLLLAQEPINFNSVAKESGVSKATLYNHDTIRERIERLRTQQEQSPTPKQIKRVRTDETKDAIIESLKIRIKRLEAENKKLKEQVKSFHAKIYEEI
ncbi:transposase [Turicibacter sanguinis]|uniref:DUF6262 family protein n=1 Tax=Turicibacter TaxID=191303 RepID=UPI0012B8B483|nr:MULTISPECIES: DUF6262 family protein [Turicibacter]MBP3904665.1 transposase [Turicibacter sp.]MBP3908170.1 transposase [Turicibacter sp.]MCU7192460.1 DUF6262 family protein [Turicibacter sanguinis]MCU7202081.1 DUF6262 family protein [Turicibacter sanguinis]MTH08195.1 transposase [Turicibacter sanguinis]